VELQTLAQDTFQIDSSQTYIEQFNVKSLDTSKLSDVLLVLHKLSSLNDFPTVDILTNIFDSLIYKLKENVDYDISDSLCSLTMFTSIIVKSKYVEHWSDFPKETRENLSLILEKTVINSVGIISSVNETQLSNTLDNLTELFWSLGKLNCNIHADFSTITRKRLVVNILNDSLALDILSTKISKMLFGLSNMCLSWSDIVEAAVINASIAYAPPILLAQSLSLTFKKMSNSEIFSTIQSLSKMNAVWSMHFPSHLRKAIFLATERAVPTANAATLSNLIRLYTFQINPN